MDRSVDDRLTDIAVEYGMARRAVGRSSSTCAARRVLLALRVSDYDRALDYAALACKRHARWKRFAVMVRALVQDQRVPVPARAR